MAVFELNVESHRRRAASDNYLRQPAMMIVRLPGHAT